MYSALYEWNVLLVRAQKKVQWARITRCKSAESTTARCARSLRPTYDAVWSWWPQKQADCRPANVCRLYAKRPDISAVEWPINSELCHSMSNVKYRKYAWLLYSILLPPDARRPTAQLNIATLTLCCACPSIPRLYRWPTPQAWLDVVAVECRTVRLVSFKQGG